MRIKSLSWDDTHHLRNIRCSILTILGATLRIQKPNHQAEYPNKVYTTFRMRNSQTILSWTQNKMYKDNIICKLYTRKCEKNNSPKSTLSFRLANIIFVYLFYYSAYFCYYSWVSLHFLGIIYESHYTISANFYLNLQYFQQKVFNFSKISGF